MPRFRFAKTGAQPDATSPLGHERPVVEPWQQPPAAPPAVLSFASISQEDRDLIEQVQTRLLAEPEPASARQDPTYFARRIATLVAEQLQIAGRVVSDRERGRLVRLA